MINQPLTVADHSRDAAALTYVYPVWSRRAGGLSIGINLNPNNACNWRCVYCQVPNLVRGSAPSIDLTKLERELRGFLTEVETGRFYVERNIPEGQRCIRDIAISGNGEPTTALAFPEVVELAGSMLLDLRASAPVNFVLITNGSQIHRGRVRRGIAALARYDGEVWYKLDAVTTEGLHRVNNAALSPARATRHLRLAASLCRTWIQTCVFSIDDVPPAATERAAYLECLQALVTERVPIRGVLLYGLARPSLQPEAPRLRPVPQTWLTSFADSIGRLGLSVKIAE